MKKHTGLFALLLFAAFACGQMETSSTQSFDNTPQLTEKEEEDINTLIQSGMSLLENAENFIDDRRKELPSKKDKLVQITQSVAHQIKSTSKKLYDDLQDLKEQGKVMSTIVYKTNDLLKVPLSHAITAITGDDKQSIQEKIMERTLAQEEKIDSFEKRVREFNPKKLIDMGKNALSGIWSKGVLPENTTGAEGNENDKDLSLVAWYVGGFLALLAAITLFVGAVSAVLLKLGVIVIVIGTALIFI